MKTLAERSAEAAARTLAARAVRSSLPRDVAGVAIGAPTARILIAAPQLALSDLVRLARKALAAEPLLVVFRANDLRR